MILFSDSNQGATRNIANRSYRTHGLHFSPFLGGKVRMPWKECSVMDERLSLGLTG